MISESSRYYGAVLVFLIDISSDPISIYLPEDAIPGEYIVDGKIGLLIKYSTKRKGPWNFNLHASHLARIARVRQSTEKFVVVFVCGSDGIVAIDINDLEKIVAEGPDQQAVVIRRKLKQMYGVKGPVGQLDRRLSRGSLVSLFQA